MATVIDHVNETITVDGVEVGARACCSGYQTGKYYSSRGYWANNAHSARFNTGMTAGRVYYGTYPVAYPITVDRLAVKNSNTNASAILHIAFYDTDDRGMPRNRVTPITTWPAPTFSATGVKEKVVDFLIPAGNLIYATLFETAVASMWCFGYRPSHFGGGGAYIGAGEQGGCIYDTDVSGQTALPDQATACTNNTDLVYPGIALWMRAA